MPIIYDNNTATFTIHTDNTTYQMQVDRIGNLLHLYYGRKTAGVMDWLPSYIDRGTSANPFDAFDRGYSLDALPQEYAVQGMGDTRSPSLVVRDANGTFGCDLRYVGHRILEGKYALRGLPAAYAGEGDDAQTLELTLADKRLGLEVILLYGVLPHIDVICRAVRIVNASDARVTVTKAASAEFDFVHGDFDLISFHGRHAMERAPQRREVGFGLQVVESHRGTSSHQSNPFVILADRDTTETAGRCWALQFVYSGGFKAEAERDQYEQTRVQMGLSDDLFAYPLEPGEELVVPEVIMSFSNEGFDTLSHNLHRCVMNNVCRGPWRDAVRPLLVNSWEAFYMDFDGDRIVEFARQAKELGIELVVLDDGWFSNRDDDTCGLGDWWPNEEKLGGSLGQLAERVCALDLLFGIWMEPEMVSENSKLFEEHPDWALAIPGKPPVYGRNQLVLDLSRPEVCDYIFEQICNTIDQGPISYLKWDYNRIITDIYSHGTADQGKVLYDYMLGLYSVLERVVQRYPELLIEGCTGGGGRFDAGMLHYTPQIWCSDNTDAIDRLSIQYGTSFAYPSATMGSHVSVSPNEVTRRVTPIATRAAVADSGTGGYELDLGKLSAEDKAAVREQVAWHHRIAPLVLRGRYHRLSNPLTDNVCAWSHVAEDGSEALVNAVICKMHGRGLARYVTLRGLTPGATYRDEVSGASYPADALMDMGLRLPYDFEEYESFTYLLVRE